MKNIILAETLNYLGTFSKKEQDKFITSMELSKGYTQKTTKSKVTYLIKE